MMAGTTQQCAWLDIPGEQDSSRIGEGEKQQAKFEEKVDGNTIKFAPGERGYWAGAGFSLVPKVPKLLAICLQRCQSRISFIGR